MTFFKAMITGLPLKIKGQKKWRIYHDFELYYLNDVGFNKPLVLSVKELTSDQWIVKSRKELKCKVKRSTAVQKESEWMQETTPRHLLPLLGLLTKP